MLSFSLSLHEPFNDTSTQHSWYGILTTDPAIPADTSCIWPLRCILLWMPDAGGWQRDLRRGIVRFIWCESWRWLQAHLIKWTTELFIMWHQSWPEWGTWIPFHSVHEMPWFAVTRKSVRKLIKYNYPRLRWEGDIRIAPPPVHDEYPPS